MTETGYLSGFGNEHQSEAFRARCRWASSARSGRARPVCRAVQQTAFTAPRAANRRTWFYRIRPSVTRGAFKPAPKVARMVRSAPITEVVTPPNQLRWDPLPMPIEATDFVDGLVTYAANGDVRAQAGMACTCTLRTVR